MSTKSGGQAFKSYDDSDDDDDDDDDNNDEADRDGDLSGLLVHGSIN